MAHCTAGQVMAGAMTAEKVQAGAQSMADHDEVQKRWPHEARPPPFIQYLLARFDRTQLQAIEVKPRPSPARH